MRARSGFCCGPSLLLFSRPVSSLTPGDAAQSGAGAKAAGRAAAPSLPARAALWGLPGIGAGGCPPLGALQRRPGRLPGQPVPAPRSPRVSRVTIAVT